VQNKLIGNDRSSWWPTFFTDIRVSGNSTITLITELRDR